MFFQVFAHVDQHGGVRSALTAHYGEAPLVEGDVLFYPVPADVDAVTRTALTAGAYNVVIASRDVAGATPIVHPTFSARFQEGEARARVEIGMTFAHAFAKLGQGTFAEPPTGWDGDVWCVYGAYPDLAAVAACAQMYGGQIVAADGTVVVPVAEAPVEARVIEVPAVEATASVVEAPVVEAPVVEAPVVEAPKAPEKPKARRRRRG